MDRIQHSENASPVVFAHDENNRMKHISDVESGLACKCHCPVCKSAMVARKGNVLVHHFGHEAISNCKYSPETALHILAKEIIERELVLFLPAVIACHMDISETVHSEQEINFTGAQLESRDFTGIIPDLYLQWNDRRLLVEIFVTHRCDEEKISKLKLQGIAAVEIDLSHFPRESARGEVREAVLRTAPRIWLYHPKIETKIRAMQSDSDAQEARRKAVRESKLKQVTEQYEAGVTFLSKRKSVPLHPKAELVKAGYEKHVGVEVDGYGCFLVSPLEWQYLILGEAFLPTKDGAGRSWSVKQVLARLKKRNVIRADFKFVPEDVEQELSKREIGFLSPYRSIEKYLKELEKRGVLTKGRNGFIASGLIKAVYSMRKADTDRRKREASLMEGAARILQSLPASEQQGISPQSWLHFTQSNGMSLTQALAQDNPSVDEAIQCLQRIETMIIRSGQVEEETLGLPLEMEIKRQIATRKAEAVRREAKRVRDFQEAKDKRVNTLRSAASDKLGTDSESWLTSPNPTLAAKTPIQLAEIGDRECERAVDELWREAEKRLQIEQRNQKTADLREKLISSVNSILGRDVAKAFLSSPYVKLQGKKPLDHCVSAQTLQQCVELAQEVKRKRR